MAPRRHADAKTILNIIITAITIMVGGLIIADNYRSDKKVNSPIKIVLSKTTSTSRW